MQNQNQSQSKIPEKPESDSETICQSLRDTDSLLSEGSKKDINVFISYVVKDASGKKAIQAEIHCEMQWHIDECERRGIKFCGILAPWGHGKTFQVIIARTLDYLGKNKNARIFIVTNTDENSKARVASISRYILTDEDYNRVYPEIKPGELGEWTKHKIIVDRDSKGKDGSVEAWGVSTSGTGSRCDILIFDDPVDMRNAIINPGLRQPTKDNMNNVWLSRLVPNGRVIYIATIWHQDDYTSDILKNEEWKFLVMKISEDFNSIECKSPFKGSFKIALWDAEWNKVSLLSRFKVIGKRAFNRGFRQEALTDEDRTFPSSDVIFKTDVGLEIIRPEWARCIGMDPFGKFVVIFTLALSPQGVRYPIEIRRGRWDPTRSVNELIDAYARHNAQVIVVENNAAQDAIIQWAREKGRIDMPVIPFVTGVQKADPILGLPSIEVEFANGAWIVPLGKVHQPDCQCNWCIWKKEMHDHPLGITADIVMSAWFAREGARFLTNRAEEEVPDIVTAEEVGIEPVEIGDY